MRHIRAYQKEYRFSRWYGRGNSMNADAARTNAMGDGVGPAGGSGGLVQTHAEPVGGRQQVQRFSFDIAPISRYKFSLLAVTSECDACLCQGSLIVPPRRQPGDRVRSNNVLLEFADVAARLDDLRRRLSLPVDYGRLPAGNNFDDLMKWNITRCYCWRARVSFNLALYYAPRPTLEKWNNRH